MATRWTTLSLALIAFSGPLHAQTPGREDSTAIARASAAPVQEPPRVQQTPAPQPYARNTVFLELVTAENPFKTSFYRGGLAYERLLRPELGVATSLSVQWGKHCSVAPPGNPEWCNLIVTRIPATLNRLWTDGNNRFELGGGIMLGYSAPAASGAHAEGFLYSTAFRVGYRYHPPQGGLFLSLTWLARFFGNASNPAEVAMGIGYAF